MRLAPESLAERKEEAGELHALRCCKVTFQDLEALTVFLREEA